MIKKESIFEFLFLTAAMFVISIGVYFFLIPSGIVVGSISGLAMVVSELTGFSISLITMILNVGLLVIGFIFIGKEFGIKTVYTSTLLPVFLALFEWIIPLHGSITGNSVYDLACNVLLLGFGQAILFHINASSGGLDIAAKIVNKYTNIEIGQAVTITGLITAMSAIFVYDIGTLIISILGTLANGQVVDYFIGGINKKKRICIVSDRYEEIQSYILNSMKRGVTLYQAQGGFEKENRTELVTIMNNNEYKTLLDYLHHTDFKVFVTISTVNEVVGLWNTKHRF